MRESTTRRLGSVPGQAPANKGRKFRAEPLSRAEANALIGACSAASRTGIRNRALLAVMYRGGLRIAEALALRPADADPDRGTIRVLDGKGGKPRTVGVDAGAMASIQRWMDTRRAAGIRRGPLFATLAGGQMSPQYVRAMMTRAADKAGIERRVHPHGLRHTMSAEWIQEGRSPVLLRDQLGHTSLAVTDRYLRDIAPGEVIAAAHQRQWTEPGPRNATDGNER